MNAKTLGLYDMQKMLPKWKAILPWLKTAPSSALVETGRDLDKAFQNFFRRVKRGEKPGYPKYKHWYDSTQSYRTQVDNKCLVDDRHVKLPKLGVVKCRISQSIEGRVLNATVKRVPSGKYFVVICCTDVPEPEMPMGDKAIGIDAGLHDLMVRSDGVKVPNNRHLRNAERRLRREQRKLSRRKKGSANRRKQQRKVAMVYEKVANQRRDDINKATTNAVRDARAIAVENLNVKGMAKNHKMAKSVHDASMSEMIRQLEYKCAWYGRDFVKVDRWFPSTQICGNCGAVTGPKGKEGLKDRHWTCPECGATHDRDLNAAKNIAKEAFGTEDTSTQVR